MKKIFTLFLALVSSTLFSQELNTVDWEIYDYVLAIPTTYTITSDKDDFNLEVPDLYSTDSWIREAFPNERTVDKDGTRKSALLLSINDINTDEWKKAEKTSVCFVITKVSFDFSNNVFGEEATVSWQFFDIRNKWDEPFAVITKTAKIRKNKIFRTYIDLNAAILEASEELKDQVRRDVGYIKYNENRAWKVFGDLYGEGINEMLSLSNSLSLRSTSGPYAQMNLPDLNESDFRDSIGNFASQDNIIGIWKTYRQGTNTNCRTERFGIMPVDKLVFKACLLPELGTPINDYYWQTGDVRFLFEKTSKNGVYAADRIYVSNATKNKDIAETYVRVEDGILEVHYEDWDGVCKYIKLYPESKYDHEFDPTDEGQDVLSGTGSCVLIDSKNGILVTNWHVVENTSRISIMIDGRNIEADIIQKDPSNDLALLKLKETSNLPASCSINSMLKVGMDVVAIGFPKATTMGTDVKVTKGIISALSFLQNTSQMQIDCSITNGNSGGGLFDSDNNLVGITSFGYRPDKNTENVNGAIKPMILLNLIQLIEDHNISTNQKNDFSLEDAMKTVGLIKCYSTK